MNKLATLSLLAASALTIAPKPVHAGDKEAAIIGGMVIGGIIGAVIANNTDNCGPTPAPVYCPPAPVVYQPAPVVCEPTGYWSNVQVQVLVPGCWSVRYDCGRQVRYFVPAHYEYRTNRVWVAHNNRYDNHRNDNRGGREVSRGYGRDNDRNRNDDRRRNH